MESLQVVAMNFLREGGERKADSGTVAGCFVIT